jgi:hypothetical protein
MDLREAGWWVRTESIWLRIRTGDGLLWIRWWTFRFHKTCGKFLTSWRPVRLSGRTLLSEVSLVSYPHRFNSRYMPRPSKLLEMLIRINILGISTNCADLRYEYFCYTPSRADLRYEYLCYTLSRADLRYEYLCYTLSRADLRYEYFCYTPSRADLRYEYFCYTLSRADLRYEYFCYTLSRADLRYEYFCYTLSRIFPQNPVLLQPGSVAFRTSGTNLGGGRGGAVVSCVCFTWINSEVNGTEWIIRI